MRSIWFSLVSFVRSGGQSGEFFSILAILLERNADRDSIYVGKGLSAAEDSILPNVTATRSM